MGQQSPDIAQGVDQGPRDAGRHQRSRPHGRSGRGRPGPHVRLRVGTRRRPSHARGRGGWRTACRSGWRLRPQDGRRCWACALTGKTQVTVEVRRRPPRRDRHGGALHAARRRTSSRRKLHVEVGSEHVIAPVLESAGLEWSGAKQFVNPTGQFRHRWSSGRRRPDRPQDHRRYLRRLGPARRRGVPRQRPLEGRSERGVHDPLGGQERRRRGSCRACEAQVAYAIGEAQPVGVNVETDGTRHGARRR